MTITLDQAQAIYDGQMPDEPPDAEWCDCGRAIGVPEDDEEEFICDDCQEQQWECGFRRNNK